MTTEKEGVDPRVVKIKLKNKSCNYTRNTD